jgi:hypothetical protein
MDIDAKALGYDWTPNSWLSPKRAIPFSSAAGPWNRRQNEEQCESCLKLKSHPSDHRTLTFRPNRQGSKLARNARTKRVKSY